MSNTIVIFDLDQTIVDSSVLENLRHERKWGQVYEDISRCHLYEGIDLLLQDLRQVGIKTTVVTSSPRPYAERVIDHFQLSIDDLVAYHDTTRHKPDPAPIRLALGRLRATETDAASIGDDPKDIVSSAQAGVYSIGAMWGCSNPAALQDAQADTIAETIPDLRKILIKRFNLVI